MMGYCSRPLRPCARRLDRAPTVLTRARTQGKARVVQRRVARLERVTIPLPDVAQLLCCLRDDDEASDGEGSPRPAPPTKERPTPFPGRPSGSGRAQGTGAGADAGAPARGGPDGAGGWGGGEQQGVSRGVGGLQEGAAASGSLAGWAEGSSSFTLDATINGEVPLLLEQMQPFQGLGPGPAAGAREPSDAGASRPGPMFATLQPIEEGPASRELFSSMVHAADAAHPAYNAGMESGG